MNEFAFFKKVWKYARKYKWYFLLSYFFLLAELFFSQVLPLSLERVLDAAIYQIDIELFFRHALIYLTLFILQQFSTFGQLQTWQRTNNKFIYSLRESCFESVINSKAYLLANNNSGDIIHTINTDVTEFQHLMQRCAMRVINAGIGTIVSIIFVSIMKWEIAVIICVLILCSVLLTNFLKKNINKFSVEIRDKQGEYTSWLFEILKGIQTIKLFASKNNVLNALKKKNDEIYLIGEKYNNLQVLHSQMVSGVYFFARMIFYAISAIYVINDFISIAQFISIGIYYDLISKNFQKILLENMLFQTRKVSVDRVIKVLEADSESESLNKNEGIKDANIKIEKLDFSYDGVNPIFSNLSIDITAGEKIGIVGQSGVGKTSLAYLLLRFYDANSGYIYIDGKNISEYSYSTLRSNIGIVNQENIIFDLSVKDNICFGREIEDSVIWELLELVELKSDIQKLPAGINTYLGEGGVALSGGQRQRLAIARMLFRNPRIIILDEATSALDAELAKSIESILNKVLKGRTSLIISHKHSFLKNTDRIYVLKNGKIVESGTYQELTRSGDEFQRVFEISKEKQC